MSPDQGRRRGKGGGRGAPGRPARPALSARLYLIAFGAAFAVLFAVVAIAEGVGNPSVPAGDVALVEGMPGTVGEVSEADFKHALVQAASQAGEKKAPKPGDPKYEELKETAVDSQLEPIWLQGLGEEMGITVSEKEIAEELKKIKKESFKSEAEFEKFKKEAHYTDADVNNRVKLQTLSTRIQAKLKEEVPTPTQSEIKDYYAAAKATQFTQKPSREVRLVVNKDRKKAEEAKEALSKDDSAKNWEKVAKKYSEDPTTKGTGGLQKGVQEGVLEEPLNAAVFSTPEGRVEGPISAKRGFTVFEVENSTPESVQELKAVEGQIKSTLAQRAEQEYFTTFVSNFNVKWSGRTFCASGYVTKRCSNYKSSDHPPTAPPACYEANPKGGLPEACPAPVFQLVPALPGTVSPLEPKGKPLAQRPHPAGGGSESAAAATGLPGGAVPPAEAPSEAPSE